jgi:hypothetical protein
MTPETLALLGIIFLTFSVWLASLAIIAGLCYLSNAVSHLVIEAYGGWKTFFDYRIWYLTNYKRKQNEI